ncbi:hypothetical protein DP129_10855 [Clostridium tetani]|uniref:hypothetical protein n=1 Tax=Clostridium tetani TaxID=1513 RepID=UPI00100B2986|nr:hypothetical protein [Clostridium tetani]RXI38711.1 hypothetical protein DP129_10855 [Clostridium tetani]
MSDLREKEYRELTKLIYCDLPKLLQKIICTSHHYVGCDVPKESFELVQKYIQEYINETKRVTNLTLDGQLATLKKIISEN